MKNANLEIELAEAAFSQKFLIYSAIKFYLNHFYPNSQSEKFTELEITGVRYDQVIKAPDIRLVTDKPTTTTNIFKNLTLDSMLHQNWIFNGDDSNGWLLASINLNKGGYLIT
ncbi:hypothetical protein [Rickettsia honei]|uniref:hypothetical protein n=1 Tax=Rickettsia honei TaxID=37816 RepID=UPI000305D9F1|nr:hypothetical protein [Rickettsia honei]